MSDLKEFLEHAKYPEMDYEEEGKDCQADMIKIQDLGLFFWERGGKQFVERNYGKTIPSQEDKKYYEKYIHEYYTIKGKNWFDMRTLKGLIELAKNGYGLIMHLQHAQDFLDCLACLGEEQVKELIKELEGEVK